jgi:hypothetical protein
MKDKKILIDCDGVLMNWEYAFNCWMEQRGYIIKEGSVAYDMGERYGLYITKTKELVRDFNSSAAMGFLPPLRDAMHYVRKLHEQHGYVFHMITSLSLDDHACRLRRMNTEKLFGETAFSGFTFLDTGADKDDVLYKYKDTGMTWIEDKVENAVVGKILGLDCLLMEHGHNMDFKRSTYSNITIVKNWKEIYEYLCG